MAFYFSIFFSYNFVKPKFLKFFNSASAKPIEFENSSETTSKDLSEEC